MAKLEAKWYSSYNKDIKKEIKEWTDENLPNYICADSLRFEHNKLTGSRSLYFIPRGMFLKVTKYSNGTIAADFNDMLTIFNNQERAEEMLVEAASDQIDMTDYPIVNNLVLPDVM